MMNTHDMPEHILAAYQRLYQQLVAQGQSNNKPADHEDIAMIDFYAAEAFQQVDLEHKYPDFFQKLMCTPALFEAFINTLKELEENPNMLDVPGPLPRFNLDFLAEEKTIDIQTKQLADWWSLAVEMSRRHIDELFQALNGGGNNLQPVMRSGSMLQLDPKVITFLDKVIEIDGLTLHLSLDGTLFSDELTLELHLFVNELNDFELPDDLWVDLRWGTLRFQEPVKAMELIKFPKIYLPEMVTGNDEFLHPLHLEIIKN